MPAIGLLHARDLPALASLDELRARLTGGSREDVRLLHAPAGEAAHTPAGLIPGVTLFGPGRSPAMTASPTGVTPLRETSSVLLHDALFLAGSMTVLDSRDRLFRDGIDNLPDPAALAEGGTLYARGPDGALALDAAVRRDAVRMDGIALPVCGVGLPNYGHFLLDGLPAVLLHAQLFADLPWRVVGQRLHPWQDADPGRAGPARALYRDRGRHRVRPRADLDAAGDARVAPDPVHPPGVRPAALRLRRDRRPRAAQAVPVARRP